MKILHTADIHLREYDDDRWKTLQKLIQIGKKEDVEIFVISGDLFDRGIDAEVLKIKIRDLFSNNGFKILFIPGNHDKNSYKTGIYFGDDVVILNEISKSFKYKDVEIWGMPFEPIKGETILNRLHSLAKSLDPGKKNILLYHGELLDAFFSRKDLGDEGEERYMPVKLSYFKDLKIDYVLAGHFHSRFDFWRLQSGGYFVYPGSPISITRRETGRRKVNLFEVGKPPQEYPLDSPYYEEVVIKLDPIKDKNPVENVKTRLGNLPPEAMVLLTVKGFINGEVIKMSEKELKMEIDRITGNKCIEKRYEFSDIRRILEDDLFKKFMEKLQETDLNEEKKREMRDLAIEAMMETMQ